MSKIVVRSRNRVYSIVGETIEEKRERFWNEKYQLFLEFIKLYGHQKFQYDKPNKKYNPKFDTLGGWVSWQRKLYIKGKLIDWRFKLLEKAGIIWEPLELLWNNQYIKLLEYKTKYSDCDVSTYDKDYPGLGAWLYTQRRQKTKLDKLRFQKLEELGVDWTIKANSWDVLFERFKKFSLENSNQSIPYEKGSKHYKPNDDSLNSWIVVQRQRYKNSQLPEWKYELLTEAGFLWEPLEILWNINYDKLVEFKRKYGHCNVSINVEGYGKLSSWVSTQRLRKKKLTHERLQKLEDIGFDWGYSCEKWDTMYELLKSYYKENGIAYVPGNVSKNSTSKQFKMLTKWCESQIDLYNHNKLPKDRIQLLKEINFEFEYTQSKKFWLEKYQRLVEYKNRYGHCNVPRQWKEDVSLANWVLLNRQNQNRLSRDKYNKLNELGFSWDYSSELWDNHIAMLKQFKEKHGHCDITESNDKSLVCWILYLKSLKKLNLMHRLTEDKIKELNELGFEWDQNETTWRKNYQLLVEYKNKNGHCNVSTTNTKLHLAGWFRYLWKLKKENELYLLDADKIRKLDELGFEWDPDENLWQRNYQLLVEFKNKNGHCNVSCKTKSHLAKWIKYLRKLKKENKLYRLDADKIRKLDELGFDWDPNETVWERNYQLLVEFKNKNGHCNVIGSVKHKNLYNWCLDKRKNQSKLPKDKIDKLDELGFDWDYNYVYKNDKWVTMFELLKGYYEENGIAYVSGNVSNNSSSKQLEMLTQWCRTQISHFHKNKLSSDRIQLLKEINFDFEHNTTKQENIWLEKYQRLVEYKKRFGHCNVPYRWKEDYSLGVWVGLNRKNKNRLRQDKYNKLNELGFSWDRNSDLWNSHIVKLKQFIEKHGHCKVPKSTDKALARWICNLRKTKKSNLKYRLTEDKIKELNEIGFDWGN